MKITKHGSAKSPFFKGVTTHSGIRLAFFGGSLTAVVRKEQEWLKANRLRQGSAA